MSDLGLESTFGSVLVRNAMHAHAMSSCLSHLFALLAIRFPQNLVLLSDSRVLGRYFSTGCQTHLTSQLSPDFFEIYCHAVTLDHCVTINLLKNPGVPRSQTDVKAGWELIPRLVSSLENSLPKPWRLTSEALETYFRSLGGSLREHWRLTSKPWGLTSEALETYLRSPGN